ncbi:MAG: hypothetical protein CMF62_01600 [Magnetococcales bacterium]|nr:hypothetical protein [Magnetococcales bacterium]|tara:strand:+ start:48946 stop:50217 length:1272 start_codon:yes stop_codon:yes gene_type:complete
MDHKVYKKIFKNGMKLLGIPTKSNIVSIGIYVNIGSRYESKNNHGVAHFLEHMMFKGTKNISGKELSLKLDSVGAVYNAGTSYEYTYYYIYGHKNDINLFIDLIFDLYFNPKFDDDDIKKERQVVLEELQMSNDSISNIIYDILHKKTFSNSNLSRNILGTQSSIKSLTKEKLKDFRNKYYVPNNSLVVISGGFEPNKIYSKIKKIINSHSKKIFKKETPKKAKLQLGKPKIYHTINKVVNQTHIIISFKTSHRNDKNIEKIELIENLLSSGSSSRLFELLRNKMGVTYFNYASYLAFEYEGVFMIHLGVDNSKIVQTINAIFEELRNLKENGIDETELNKIKKIRTTAFSLALQDPRDLMTYYGLSELFYNKKDYSIKKVIDRYNNIKLKDFNKTLKSTFNPKVLKVFVNGAKFNSNKIIDF